MPRAATKPSHRHHGTLPLGDDGVDLTVQEHMERLALRDATSKEIRSIAQRISSKCQAPVGSEAGDYCRIWNAFKTVVDTVSYVNDPATAEHITAPKYLMTSHPKGDCDCMATALASILLALGYRSQFKVIAWRELTFTHVYLEVLVPSKNVWVPLDPVFQIPGNRYHGFGMEKHPIIRKKLYPVGASLNDRMKPATSLGAIDPSSATATQIITNARLTLAGSTRRYMKTGDVDYATRLVNESRSRRLTSTELAWLQSFSRYYREDNIAQLIKDSKTVSTNRPDDTDAISASTPHVPPTSDEQPTPWLLYAGVAAAAYVGYLFVMRRR